MVQWGWEEGPSDPPRPDPDGRHGSAARVAGCEPRERSDPLSSFCSSAAELTMWSEPVKGPRDPGIQRPTSIT